MKKTLSFFLILEVRPTKFVSIGAILLLSIIIGVKTSVAQDVFNPNGSNSASAMLVPEVIIKNKAKEIKTLGRFVAYTKTFNHNSISQRVYLITGASYTNGHVFIKSKNGSRYAVAIYGEIFKLWEQLGGEKTIGRATADEAGCPDGRGRYNFFSIDGEENAKAIYWRPERAAILIGGRILKYWASKGYEKSVYGYPRGFAYKEGPYTMQNFEGGHITIDSRTGEVSGSPNVKFDNSQ